MVMQLSSVNKLAITSSFTQVQYSNQKLQYNNHVNLGVHVEVGGKHVLLIHGTW